LDRQEDLFYKVSRAFSWL